MVTEALLCSPFASVAMPLMVCVPIDISFLLHVVAHEVVPAHFAKELPSAVITIDVMPAPRAEVVMLILPFCMLPLVGALIVTVAEAGVVTETLADWGEALPAAS
jgi:hypothetical protein